MSIKDGVAQIRDLVAIQACDGNWNYDKYMHGMLNGMILCLSVLTDEYPVYKKAPQKWLKDLNAMSEPGNDSTDTFDKLSRLLKIT